MYHTFDTGQNEEEEGKKGQKEKGYACVSQNDGTSREILVVLHFRSALFSLLAVSQCHAIHQTQQSFVVFVG